MGHSETSHHGVTRAEGPFAQDRPRECLFYYNCRYEGLCKGTFSLSYFSDRMFFGYRFVTPSCFLLFFLDFSFAAFMQERAWGCFLSLLSQWSCADAISSSCNGALKDSFDVWFLSSTQHNTELEPLRFWNIVTSPQRNMMWQETREVRRSHKSLANWQFSQLK